MHRTLSHREEWLCDQTCSSVPLLGLSLGRRTLALHPAHWYQPSAFRGKPRVSQTRDHACRSSGWLLSFQPLGIAGGLRIRALKERAALGHDLAIFHLVHEPDNDPLRPGFPGGVT